MQTNTTKNKAFFDWMDTPLYKEWIYTFTGSWRMRLQYNPDDVDLNWTTEDFDLFKGKLNAFKIIDEVASSSPFEWKYLKDVLSANIRYGDPSVGTYDDRGIRLIKAGDFNGLELLNDNKIYTHEIQPNRDLKHNDLLLVYKGKVGKSFLFDKTKYPEPHTFHLNLLRVRVDEEKVSPKFTYYYTLSYPFQFLVDISKITVTMSGVSASKYANMLMPVPSLSEQTKIVDFLDKESEFIDNVIKSSEVMIEQVEEFSSSMITNLVTGRIPLETFKSVNLTDLKEIDESKYDLTVKLYDQDSNSLWSWVQMKKLFDVIPTTGTGVKGGVYGNVRWIRISDFDKKGNILNKQQFKVFRERISPNHFMQDKDVFVTNTGNLNKVFYYDQSIHPQELVFDTHLIRFRFDQSKIIPKFFWYFSLSDDFKHFVDTNKQVTTVPVMSTKRWVQMRVPVPPIAEQEKIVSFLEERLAKNEELIAKLNQLIELSKEYRTSVISHAVTGNLDIEAYEAEHAQGREHLNEIFDSSTLVRQVKKPLRGKALRKNSMEKEKSYGEIFPWWEIVVDMIDSGEAKV